MATNGDSCEEEFVDILIIGAGPTGLGSAVRLHQLSTSNNCSESTLNPAPAYLVIDSAPEPGGLASTATTPEGFLFDLGGHVIFSHYKYFEDVLCECVAPFSDRGEWAIHPRASFVYIQRTFVPYPFQLHFGHLPNLEDRVRCLNGLIEARIQAERRPSHLRPANFNEWIEWTMGTGINDVFMRPYNYKVWAFPTLEMSSNWLGERVAVVNTEEAVRNVLTAAQMNNKSPADQPQRAINERTRAWGPNSSFAFPQCGGTGSIWKRVAEKAIPKERQRYNSRVVGLDLVSKIVTLEGGSKIKYDKLINTSPLDSTLRMVGLTELAARLKHSSTHIVGIGVRGANSFDSKCWLYFPEDCSPFYRCTIFSNYAEQNCPASDVNLPTLRLAKSQQNEIVDVEASPGPYHSLMFEISESIEHKPVNNTTIIDETIEGAINCGLLRPESEIVSMFYRRLEYGYPTPHIDRDNVLQEAMPFLKGHDVWNRGRFGSWKYEVSNQDHSLMLGVEAVDNILFGTPEVTLETPSHINSIGKKRADRSFSLNIS